MKKLIALLLAALLVLSMAACGASEPAPAPAAPAESKTDAPAEPKEDTPAAVETEAPEEEESPYENLTEEQAEDYYMAIMDGFLAGPVGDFIQNQNEDEAKLYVDFLVGTFGDDFMSTIEAMDGREQDQILAEAVYMVGQALSQQEQAESVGSNNVLYNDEGMPISMTLYSADLHRTIGIRLNGENAFMEPDWAMMTDFSDNYFLYIPGNYEMYTLQYGPLDVSTEDLISSFVSRRESQGISVDVSEVEYFNAGGYQWEIFTLSYEQTSTGIDKETNQEVTMTSTVYNTTCFARLSSDSALQLITGNSVKPDIADFYKDVITNSIASIDAGAGVG